jgi:hypothetical protein
MSNSVASGFSRVGNRKYRIDEKFAKSPYLSNPIGKAVDKRRRSCNNSPRGERKTAKSPRRKHGDSSDVESVLTRGSVRSYRTSQTSTYRSRMPRDNTSRMMNMKNLLLPREVDKLLRGFRQKHSNHPILTNRPSSGDNVREDDDSTIASDFALSISDEAVYKKCVEDDEFKEAIFSGDLFAAITMRSANKQFRCEDVLLPSVFPVVAVDKSGEVSDLSVHSVENVSKVPNTRSKGRKKR